MKSKIANNIRDSLKLKTSYSGLIQGSSLETQPLVSKAKSEGVTKKIDKEHVTIERIFRISLEESEKFLYLELYHAQILSQDKEIAFRINDLDDIVINIINHPERVRLYLKFRNQIFFLIC